MSRWTEKFAALSCDVDRSDRSRHIADAAPDKSRSVHSVTPVPKAEETATSSDAGAKPAAAVEHDGVTLDAWSEGFARLHPDCPPGNVPPERWVTFIDDVRSFLGSPFCAVVTTLGWKAHDLFGCDRDRPLARVDQAGLLWLLNGDRLIALTTETAVIERRTGTRQTWRRKAAEASQVLVWELPP